VEELHNRTGSPLVAAGSSSNEGNAHLTSVVRSSLHGLVRVAPGGAWSLSSPECVPNRLFILVDNLVVRPASGEGVRLAGAESVLVARPLRAACSVPLWLVPPHVVEVKPAVRNPKNGVLKAGC